MVELQARLEKGCEMKMMVEMAKATAKSGIVRSAVALIAAIGLGTSPVIAQDIESFDPDQAFKTENSQSGASATGAGQTDDGGIDADLMRPGAPSTTPSVPTRVDQTAETRAVTTTSPGFDDEFSDYSDTGVAEVPPQPDAPSNDWILDEGSTGINSAAADAAADNSATYGGDDLIGAAEGVFGKGAKGLAGLIEDLLKKEGEPNGYIIGREAGGAFILGARYGSGTLHHKIEGQRKVYWTGPSIGFDAGANAGSSFVLVYNLYDSEDLYKRYPAGEGQAYLVGGLHVSYMRRGDVVLIPIRVGAGLRLGVNAGYMKFSKKQRWLPF